VGGIQGLNLLGRPVVLRIEINDHTDVPLSRAHDFALRAENAGIDGIGVHDHQGSGHDVFVRLAEIANRTSRVTLFPSVTNPVTRHPAVVAASANSLAELHPGRIRIMIGSGDLATSAVGLRPATVAGMRESAMAIRALLRGESATLDGTSISKLGHVSEQTPDVYVNGSSPRMLTAAGEAADGVYAMVGVHPAVVHRAREHIADGTGSRDVPVAWGVPIYMGDTREAALEGMRAYAFSNISKPRKVFATVIGERHPELPTYEHAADIPLDVLAMLADGLGIVGTPSECGERLAAFVGEAKPNHIVGRIFYAGEDSMRALEALVEDVLPPVMRGA
jgi:5,10-methylenetetrahydromethanopterin reductase